MKRLGFIGIGLMGLPMSMRFLAAGYPLAVWNRSPSKCRPLQIEGAAIAATPEILADEADIIFICVSDTAAVEAVVHGEQGLLKGLSPGKIIVDLSSIDPTATRALAAEAETKGAQWVDAPVSGGVMGAESGSLVIMAGGDAATIDSLCPVLEAVSQRVTYMGASGSGQVTKLCNQLIVAANAVLIAEAVALAEKAGVDAAKLAPALAGGFADSKPFQLMVPRMSSKNFDPVQWRVKTLLKDLDTAVAQASHCGLDTPVAQRAASVLHQHADNGFLEKDLSSLIRHFIQ